MALTHLMSIEPVRHLPLPPTVIGLVAFLLLLALMGALLMFGKGRPHC
ncbi:MAG: hypothetical protein ACR2KG_09475 [Nocardioidaceae bacterium]